MLERLLPEPSLMITQTWLDIIYFQQINGLGLDFNESDRSQPMPTPIWIAWISSPCSGLSQPHTCTGTSLHFLCSRTITFIHEFPLFIPKLSFPKDCTVNITFSVKYGVSWGLVVMRKIASCQEMKMFLAVIVGL